MRSAAWAALIIRLVEGASLKTDPEHFILANTSLIAPPHVPEIRLRLASEVHDLWLKTEEDLQEIGLPPPFWAFAWAGGQGLARYVLDHRESFASKRVLDFASGSGLVAIAAKIAGASDVLATDTDPWAEKAVGLNARENGVDIDFTGENLIGGSPRSDIVLAGDVFYDRDLAGALVPWFARLAEEGKQVLIGDPGRSYCPTDRMEALATYQVPVTRALEDSEVKKTTVWRFR